MSPNCQELPNDNSILLDFKLQCNTYILDFEKEKKRKKKSNFLPQNPCVVNSNLYEFVEFDFKMAL